MVQSIIFTVPAGQETLIKHSLSKAQRVVALLLLALLLASVTGLAYEVMTKGRRPASATLAKDLRVTIVHLRWDDQPPWDLSQSILAVTCENLSSQPLVLGCDPHDGEQDQARQFSFEVRDSKGTQIPLTRYGKLLQQSASFISHRESLGGSSIPPHKSFTYLVDLSRFVDISKPDVYTVTATFTPANPVLTGSVTSNTISMEIDSDGMTM